jgi:pimeloyl-ACP methyl ester carboxylesterase
MSRFHSKTATWLIACVAIVAALLIVPTSAGAQISRTSHRSDQDGAKPTIVLVHGAWADGSSWDQVIPILQQRYTIDAPPNPLQGSQ